MEVEKKVNVAFMTTLDREMFPMKMPQNRFGNDLNPIRGAPHRGPGCYDNEPVSNFKYLTDHKVQSQKGYVLGARTAQRFREKLQNTPAPTKYQTKCTDPKLFDEAFKPFNAASARFPVYKRDLEVGPGAGTYEHSIPQNRQVSWHQSFGGEPINLPQVKIQSTINRNTDKLLSTKEEKKYHRRLAYLKLYY
ncbi:ciliary microtubule-associated protein 3-like [Tubulanus polymorphus]|uniref:ciliary microtubule-associated protein 3-like n=1 Tax=Tubulanus polymorphus TaxID=672921 RepID=UPI003DA67B8B